MIPFSNLKPNNGNDIEYITIHELEPAPAPIIGHEKNEHPPTEVFAYKLTTFTRLLIIA